MHCIFFCVDPLLAHEMIKIQYGAASAQRSFGFHRVLPADDYCKVYKHINEF